MDLVIYLMSTSYLDLKILVEILFLPTKILLLLLLLITSKAQPLKKKEKRD